MAKITGVQTGWKGKVGNFVFSMLNGTQIVKTRVIPHNPQSSAQQANRTRLSNLVEVVKKIASGWIAIAWSTTISGNQTTWGNFLRENLNAMGSAFDITKLVPSIGSVGMSTVTSGTYDTATGEVDLSFSTAPDEPNAEGSDLVAVMIVDEDQKAIRYATYVVPETVRADDSATISIASGFTASNLTAYLVFYRGEWVKGGVTAISNASRFVLTTPA